MRRVPAQVLIPSEWKVLYLTNATFHTSVDTFAAMIPLFIDGLAVHAEKVDEWAQQQTRMAMITPGFKVPPLPDFAAGES